MAQVLVRGLDKKLIARLKQQAKANKRSLEAELREIIAAATTYTHTEAADISRRLREELAGRVFPDSVDLIREDRAR
ncbi:MAG: hypothetical protein IT464_13820 [Planctomycetes bacterium]|nr:hypothetical protein [Planctomycetota bacterium]